MIQKRRASGSSKRGNGAVTMGPAVIANLNNRSALTDPEFLASLNRAPLMDPEFLAALEDMEDMEDTFSLAQPFNPKGYRSKAVVLTKSEYTDISDKIQALCKKKVRGFITRNRHDINKNVVYLEYDCNALAPRKEGFYFLVERLVRVTTDIISDVSSCDSKSDKMKTDIREISRHIRQGFYKEYYRQYLKNPQDTRAMFMAGLDAAVWYATHAINPNPGECPYSESEGASTLNNCRF